MGNCCPNEEETDPEEKKNNTKRSIKFSIKKRKDSKASKGKKDKKKREDNSNYNTLNVIKIENKQILISSDDNNGSTKTSLVPSSTKASYQTESPLVKSIKNDPILDIKDIRDCYDSDKEDIYQYTCFTVRELLKKLEKYEFPNKPSSKLEIQQLKTYKCGDRYFGQINPITKKREGHGIYIWKNGGIYEGNWDCGKINGKGRRIYTDGRIYQGLWKDEKKHGYGVCVWPNGKNYEGDWKDNMPNGKGHMKFPNGDEYKGDFEDGQGTGEGVYIFKDGRIYEGKHVNFLANGMGVMYFPDAQRKLEYG